MPSIFRKILSTLSLALVLLSSCAPAASTPHPAALVVAAPDGIVASALEAAARVYSPAGGETVQIESVRLEAINSADYTARIDAALLAGVNSYDLVYLPAEELAKWAGYRAIQPLDFDGSTPGDLAALAPWLPDVTIDGKIYGLPSQPDALVLWYRVDLLASAGLQQDGVQESGVLGNGVPTLRDWPSLRQAAQALNRPPERYGVALAGSDVEAGQDFAAVLASFGGQAVADRYASADKQMSGVQQGAGDRLQVEINSPEARQALETYISFRPLAPPGVSGFTRSDVLAALSGRRAAFGIAPLSSAGALFDCAANPKVCQENRPLLSWSWLPGLDEQTAVGSLGAWAIPLHAAHADQARRFATWLASKAGAQAWARGGGTPAHTDVLAALARETSALAGVRAEAALAKVNTYRLAFPPLRTEAELMKACAAAVNSAVNGKQTPAQALDTAAEQMRVALRRGGY